MTQRRRGQAISPRRRRHAPRRGAGPPPGVVAAQMPWRTDGVEVRRLRVLGQSGRRCRPDRVRERIKVQLLPERRAPTTPMAMTTRAGDDPDHRSSPTPGRRESWAPSRCGPRSVMHDRSHGDIDASSVIVTRSRSAGEMVPCSRASNARSSRPPSSRCRRHDREEVTFLVCTRVMASKSSSRGAETSGGR